jgi:hypothetical protein
MRHFTQVGAGIDVAPILAELDAHPELWRSYDARQTAEDSPHTEADDIWARGPAEELQRADATTVMRPFQPVWWPAWWLLPSLHPHIFGLAHHIRATDIGSILITRMPPGSKIGWHTDPGWHAETYNPKLYLPLRANEQCVNAVSADGAREALVMKPGEVWSFDNLKRHAVVNGGATERIVVIACMRCT